MPLIAGFGVLIHTKSRRTTFDMEFIQEETSHAYTLSEEAADFSFNRSTCVEMASTLILNDPIHLLFGYGVGSGNTSEKFGTWISATYSKITSYNWFTSSWLLIEYGWVGYIIWGSAGFSVN